jgi:hypothetical protein
VDRHPQLVVGVVGPSTVMRGEVAYRLSQTVGRQPPRTGAEWSIAVVHMAVAVGQILRPGDAGRFLRRWQRRHAAVQVGYSTNDRHGGSRRRGQPGGSMAEVVDPSILLADYQAKVERLIPASERGPGLSFLMLLLPVAN